ncbi:MAG TPA: MTH1187 family thiamine-binding protein [Acidimicrobiia bacterium]|nr:MTH1187 family thiamine-binding protein [Acidimicrobiia bacterium]
MLAAFSVTPLGAGDSVGELVADAVRIVRESGLPNETNAMFTNIEGEWDEVMAVIQRCVEAVAARSPRVSIVIKIDHRPGFTDALHGKMVAVERELGRPGARDGDEEQD